MNIKPNVSDTIRHDPSPMHEARHRSTGRNARYLHTVRRVAPVLSRTRGLVFRVIPRDFPRSHSPGDQAIIGPVFISLGNPSLARQNRLLGPFMLHLSHSETSAARV